MDELEQSEGGLLCDGELPFRFSDRLLSFGAAHSAEDSIGTEDVTTATFLVYLAAGSRSSFLDTPLTSDGVAGPRAPVKCSNLVRLVVVFLHDLAFISGLVPGPGELTGGVFTFSVNLTRLATVERGKRDDGFLGS